MKNKSGGGKVRRSEGKIELDGRDDYFSFLHFPSLSFPPPLTKTLRSGVADKNGMERSEYENEQASGAESRPRYSFLSAAPIMFVPGFFILYFHFIIYDFPYFSNFIPAAPRKQNKIKSSVAAKRDFILLYFEETAEDSLDSYFLS